MNEQIRELRKKLGMSQQQMANILGISRSKMALIEYGKRQLRGSVLDNLAHLKEQAKELEKKNWMTEPQQQEILVESIKEAESRINEMNHKIRIMEYKHERNTEKFNETFQYITILQEELRVFATIPLHQSRLQMMYDRALNTLYHCSPIAQEQIELKIAILRLTIDKTQEFVDRWKNKLIN